MKESLARPYRLARKISRLFDLESEIDAVLSISMYYLNQLVQAERSSIFLFNAWNRELSVLSSLDLKKHEIRIPTSCSIAGWVFENRDSAVINNVHEDCRFYKKVDEITGFQTRSLICTPLIDRKGLCIGTLQSMNSEKGCFSCEDLEMLEIAAGMVAVAIKNSRLYNEMAVTNQARRKFIHQIVGNIGDPCCHINSMSNEQQGIGMS